MRCLRAAVQKTDDQIGEHRDDDRHDEAQAEQRAFAGRGEYGREECRDIETDEQDDRAGGDHTF